MCRHFMFTTIDPRTELLLYIYAYLTSEPLSISHDDGGDYDEDDDETFICDDDI